MARAYRESASESESGRATVGNSTGANNQPRATQKAKNQANLQAQQSYLSKHIHSNGPQDFPKVHPLDFELFDDEVLIKYNERFGMGLPEPVSINDDILNSELGKRTCYKKAQASLQAARVSKPDHAAHSKAHFMNLPCRENEIISSFLYKVKNQDKQFKLTFK